MSYNRELSECVFLIFNRNNEYKDFADVLTAVHVDNNTLFQDIVFIFKIRLMILVNYPRKPLNGIHITQMLRQ